MTVAGAENHYGAIERKTRIEIEIQTMREWTLGLPKKGTMTLQPHLMPIRTGHLHPAIP